MRNKEWYNITRPDPSEHGIQPVAAGEPIGFGAHDHARCVDRAMNAAEAYCADHGLRLTPVRRAALEILLREHRAMGAYDLLERLHEAGFGSHPPNAYRALDFLATSGLVHKIERLSAFIACAHPGASHSPAFLICRKCDSVAEAQASPARGSLGAAARAAGFKIERTVVEALGLCPACAETADA
jgi:Fur family zinc uptake transcriptional regulator